MLTNAIQTIIYKFVHTVSHSEDVKYMCLLTERLFKKDLRYMVWPVYLCFDRRTTCQRTINSPLHHMPKLPSPLNFLEKNMQRYITKNIDRNWQFEKTWYICFQLNPITNEHVIYGRIPSHQSKRIILLELHKKYLKY